MMFCPACHVKPPEFEYEVLAEGEECPQCDTLLIALKCPVCNIDYGE